MSAARPPLFQPAVKAPEDREGPVWVFAFRQRELLVTESHELPTLEVLDASDLDSVRSQYLGQHDEAHCYSVELGHDAQAPDGHLFRDLRMLFGALAEDLHALAGRAVQIVEWDRTHQFCGACGGATEASELDRSRTCPNCKVPCYPRLAPAMIVAVERDDEILLARGPHFPAGIFSVLAGFVEPGESAEEAVVREVWEETRIVCEDVRYFSSQPWPYPNSLMLGFTARYASGDIEYDGEEIIDARWFKASEMPNFFPGKMSISQWLIHDFLRRNGQS